MLSCEEARAEMDRRRSVRSSCSLQPPGRAQGDRKTAAHFDDPPWLKMADHAVRHQGINHHQIDRSQIKLIGWSFPLEQFHIRHETLKNALQQIELHWVVHINPNEFARSAPERFRQRLGVGNRLVKMYRRRRETRGSPNSGTTLDVLCSEDKAALPLR